MPKASRRAPWATRELIHALPKSDLHVHLDGSLRIETLIDLANERDVKLPSRSVDGLRQLVFKRAYENLPEYLKGFEFTVACLQDAESLERAAYELAQDCHAENVCYLEVRFAPQLHVHGGFTVREVLRAVARGLERARKEIAKEPEVRAGTRPPFVAGIIVCAMRFFLPVFSEHYAAYFRALPHAKPKEIYGLASLELARAAISAVEEDGLPVVGIDLAGQERGFPAADHEAAYQLAHNHFLGKTVHAGEDYGPESIFQAITDCHADRIGHGTWLFSAGKIHDRSIKNRKEHVEKLVRYVADRRITLEVCLTSNQQTIPEMREGLEKHPFRRMRQEKMSVTLCTDNRLVSRTTVTDEVLKAVETFKMPARELKDVLTYGFKRSFFPGPYRDKRTYVRTVLDRMDAVFESHNCDVRRRT
jgi:adenosine deaminase